MKKKWIMLSITAIILAGLALWGPIMSNVEQPTYQVIATYDTIEMRQYDPLIVAQVQTTGQRQDAIGNGFRLLADYIFGNNIANDSIAMTAPVTQQSGQKIAMTAPVQQQQTQDKNWTISFVMPASYSLATLPKPNNNQVQLIEQPGKQYLAIRFAGRNTNTNLEKHLNQLKEHIVKHNITPVAKPIYAFYNPPWTLPFLKRNEILIEVAPESTN